jgi:hypothetical protein
MMHKNIFREDHRIKITFLLCLILSIVFFGCFHGEKITRVQPGMSIEQVKSIMGPQEGYKKIGDYEIYSYYNKLISGWARDRADYHYIVKDGQVVEYGAGEIRQNQNTGVVFIVPLGK